MPQPVLKYSAKRPLGGQVQTPPAKFGGFGPGAVSHFVADTVGVYAPKAVTVRSKAQLFEETFLELVEDVSFYFMLPLLGMMGLGKVFGRLAKTGAQDIERIGISTPALLEKFGKPLSKNLVAAKGGALLAGLAIAGGYEYLITPVRNMITAKWFKAKNFTAVAGLEEARLQVKDHETDPIAKGKRRLKQVGVVTAGLLGLSLVLPKLIRSSSALENGFRKILKYVDFGGTVDKTGKLVDGYDISKALLALTIGSGVASYIENSRDRLEKIETTARLALVVPYLLFGKELFGNLAAWFFENTTIGKHTPDAVKIKNLLPYRNENFKQCIRDGLRPIHFLSFDAVKPEAVFQKELNALTGKIPVALQSQLANRFHSITWVKKAFTLLVMGVALNVTNYYFTKRRFKAQQTSESQNAPHGSFHLSRQLQFQKAPEFSALAASTAANPFLEASKISPAVYNEPVIRPTAPGSWDTRTHKPFTAPSAVSVVPTGMPGQRILVRSAMTTGS